MHDITKSKARAVLLEKYKDADSIPDWLLIPAAKAENVIVKYKIMTKKC